jgi:hypothetical protein
MEDDESRDLVTDVGSSIERKSGVGEEERLEGQQVTLPTRSKVSEGPYICRLLLVVVDSCR